MEENTLYEIEKDYFLGRYQTCVNKARSLEVLTRSSIFYMCLSYYHLKKIDDLKHEVSRYKDQHICLDLIQKLSTYLQSNSSDAKETVVKQIDELLETNAIETNDVESRIVISTIYLHHKSFSKALKVLNELDSLPVMFTRIGIYLIMNRDDLATKELNLMERKEQLATLTLLASAQVKLAIGKPNEAIDTAKELEDKYNATPILKNIQAAAAISMGNYNQAKEHCQTALDMDNDNVEALINMIHILHKVKSSTEIMNRHYKSLKDKYPNHDYVREIEDIKVE